MPRNPDDFNHHLVDFLRSMYGPGRLFPSGRKWSASAGLSPGAVSTIETIGHGTPTVLIALARAASLSPLRLLEMDNHLTAEECGAGGDQITPKERLLLERYRMQDAEMQDAIDSILQRAL